MAEMDESQVKLVTFFATKLEEERQVRKKDTEELRKELNELKRQIKIINTFMNGVSTVYDYMKQRGKEDPAGLPPFE